MKILFITILLFSTFTFAEQKNDKVVVGVSGVTSTGGLFVAFEKGYFKEEGLDVELQVFTSSTAPMIPLIAKGDLDVGGGNITAGLLTSGEDGAGVLLVADKGSVREKADYIKLMVRSDLIKEGKYKKFSDLKNMTVGFTVLGGTSQEAAFARFLKKGNLKPTDVKMVKASYSDAEKLFASKSLDAFVQLEPYVAELEKSDIARAVAGVYSVHPNQQSAAIFYSPIFVKNRLDVATRFMKSYIRGCRFYNKAFYSDRKSNDFTELVAILSKWTNVKEAVTYQTMIPSGLDDNGRLNLQSLREDAQYFFDQKYLKKRPDIRKVVNQDILEKALILLDGKKH